MYRRMHMSVCATANRIIMHINQPYHYFIIIVISIFILI